MTTQTGRLFVPNGFEDLTPQQRRAVVRRYRLLVLGTKSALREARDLRRWRASRRLDALIAGEPFEEDWQR